MSDLKITASARFRLLVRELDALHWDGTPSSPRLLVFTESRLTQMHLARALAERFGLAFSDKPEDQPDQPLGILHGGMADIHLAATVESFGTGVSPLRLLLATDVASEGVNLHHQCHHIIHYDLPWSIITLIQRNGRIDRFGQRHSPVIRYLMVQTEEGFLAGDQAIFERLIEKVEEINRSTRSGESVLKLYDADKEEDYIATRGLLAGDREVLERADPETAESAELESLLLAATAECHADFLALLTGQTPETPSPDTPIAPVVIDHSRIRLMSNADFLELGYRTLAETVGGDGYPPLQKTAAQYILHPPEDLRRRLGAPRSTQSSAADVIFGATAIPEEAWPEDGHLYLTTDPERVERAIKAALAQKGQWSSELLLTDQHPVLLWLSERLMMLMQRGEAPLIVSPHLETGDLLFCFIGQVSSRAGTPLIVDAHAVSYRPGGRIECRPLKEALAEARFTTLANTGQGSRLSDNLLAGFVAGAVDESLRHLHRLKEQRQAQIKPRLDEEERRLKRWFEQRAAHIEGALRDLPPEGKRAVQLRRQLGEMERYLRDREDNWKDTHLRASDEPTTRLVLAIEGL